MKYLRILICGLALQCSALPVTANWLYTPGAGPNAFVSFNSGTTPAGTSLCAAANTDCLANVPINLAGSPLFVTGNAGLVTGTGGAFPVTQTTSPWVVTGAGGTFPATQATAASLNATVVGTGTFAVQAASTIGNGADVTLGNNTDAASCASGASLIACIRQVNVNVSGPIPAETIPGTIIGATRVASLPRAARNFPGCTVGTSSGSCLAANTAITFLQIQNASASATIACAFGATAVINGSTSVQLAAGQPANWGPNTGGVPSGALNCISSVASTPLYVEWN